jgi:hypothetical protein
MMACISSSEADRDDTLYTLSYASKTYTPAYEIQSSETTSGLDHLRQYSSYLEAKLERAYPQGIFRRINLVS